VKDGKDDHIATFDHVENPKGETVGEATRMFKYRFWKMSGSSCMR
jgi:hypothetical protein